MSFQLWQSSLRSTWAPYGLADSAKMSQTRWSMIRSSTRRLRGLALVQSDETPLYRQICEHMRAAIRAGQLRPGDRVPSTRELAAQFGTAAARWTRPMRSWRVKDISSAAGQQARSSAPSSIATPLQAPQVDRARDHAPSLHAHIGCSPCNWDCLLSTRSRASFGHA